MKKRDLIHFIMEKKFLGLLYLPDTWTCVKSRINTQICGGYAVATNVYECDDGFVGVTGVRWVYNHKTYNELGVPCTAEEYEAIQTVEYVPKN